MSDIPRNELAPMDRRKRRTRRLLLKSATQLVLEKGYEDLMTEDITELADVGRRTFYNHFVSKEVCVLAALTARFVNHADGMLRSLESLQGARQNNQSLIIATMASRMFRQIALDPITEKLIDYPGLLSEAVAESQRDYIIANIANGMASGEFKPLIPVESLEPIVAWGFVGLVVTAIPRKSQRPDSLVWAQFLLRNLGVAESTTNELMETV